MYQDRIMLTVKDIYDKEFKLDTRGYRPQEVDRFLDMIIKDYEEMNAIIRELEREKKEFLKTKEQKELWRKKWAGEIVDYEYIGYKD